MTLKINPIFATLVIAGILILIFALIKGCQHNKEIQLSNINYKEEIKRKNEDSINQAKQLIAYQDTMQFIDGQLSLSDNKLEALNDDLGHANERINQLLRKHLPIEPNPDTNITTVPNEYISECTDCFEELGKGQQLVLKYKAEKDNQEQIWKGKVNVKENRISFLEKVNTALGQTNSGLLTNIKDLQDKWMPRSRLYLTWGVLWKNYVPWAAGAGLMYQNKRNMIVGATWYYGANGTTVQTTLNFPLSLKFK